MTEKLLIKATVPVTIWCGTDECECQVTLPVPMRPSHTWYLAILQEDVMTLLRAVHWEAPEHALLTPDSRVTCSFCAAGKGPYREHPFLREARALGRGF